jgi:Cytochrome P460
MTSPRAASAACVIAAMALTGCGHSNLRVTTRLNRAAALRGDLPVNPLEWKVITSGIESQGGGMYTVFGNDAAIAYARSHAGEDYPTGSVIAMVTWQQQEDARWFGGRIPASPKSVEFVTVREDAGASRTYAYEEYEGNPFRKVLAQEGSKAGERASNLLAQRAAVMP